MSVAAAAKFVGNAIKKDPIGSLNTMIGAAEIANGIYNSPAAADGLWYPQTLAESLYTGCRAHNNKSAAAAINKAAKQITAGAQVNTPAKKKKGSTTTTATKKKAGPPVGVANGAATNTVAYVEPKMNRTSPPPQRRVAFNIYDAKVFKPRSTLISSFDAIVSCTMNATNPSYLEIAKSQQLLVGRFLPTQGNLENMVRIKNLKIAGAGLSYRMTARLEYGEYEPTRTEDVQGTFFTQLPEDHEVLVQNNVTLALPVTNNVLPYGKVPYIILTSYPQTLDRTMGLAKGADATLTTFINHVRLSFEYEIYSENALTLGTEVTTSDSYSFARPAHVAIDPYDLSHPMTPEPTVPATSSLILPRDQETEFPDDSMIQKSVEL